MLFDSSALFKADNSSDQLDPAAKKLQDGIKRTLSGTNLADDMLGDPDAIKKNDEKQREEIDKEMKAYLNPHDRFAQRMKASMGKKGDGDDAEHMLDQNGQIQNVSTMSPMATDSK